MNTTLRKYSIVGLIALALLFAGAFALPGGLANANASGSNLQPSKLVEPDEQGWYNDGPDWRYWGDPDGDGIKSWVTSTWLQGIEEKPEISGIEDIPAEDLVYWLDASGALAQNRVIDPSTENDKDPSGKYGSSCVYVDTFGQVTKGKTKVGNMVYLADETTGKLETGDDYGILKTSAYDKGTERVYYINPETHCAVISDKPVNVEGFGWVLPCNKGGYLLAGAKKFVRPASGKVAGTKVYLASTDGRLETGNSHGILGTSEYDKDKAGKPVKRYYYIRPKTHCAIVSDKPVNVEGFGWVLSCNKGGYLLAGAKKIVRPASGGTVGTKVYLARANGKLEAGNKYGILQTSAYDKGTERAYYINPKTHCAVVTSKPVKVKGFGYVFPYYKDGHLITGKKIIRPSKLRSIGTKVYLARANGKLETGNKYGILGTSRYDDTKCYYYINPKTHCVLVTGKPVKVKGFGYVFPYYKDGRLITGRKVIADKVYLARANGRLETGNAKGFLYSKRYNDEGQGLRYYINPKTHAVTYGKPVKVKGFGYVYAPNKNGNLITDVTQVDSNHVVLAERNGRICNKRGWVYSSAYGDGRQKYWLEPTTHNNKVLGARVGHFYVGGSLYRGMDRGYILRYCWQEYAGDYYWVDGNGEFLWDGVVTRMAYLAQGYSSPSSYLIMVDIDDPRVMVFEGWEGNWDVKFIWECCTGSPLTPTVTGTYSVGTKGYSFGEDHGYSCYYYTQITGDYFFHTRLYYPYTDELKDSRMGVRCSMGCVRLYDECALWIWNEAPAGTTIACIA